MRRLAASVLASAIALGVPLSGQARAGTVVRAPALANHALVFQSLTLTPSPAFTGDTLRVDAVANYPNLDSPTAGDPVIFTYEWSRNGNVLARASGPSLDLSVADNGDRGDTISVRVTASEGQLSTDASTSIVVSDSAPTAAVSLTDIAPAMNALVSGPAVAGDADNENGDHGDAVAVELVSYDGTPESGMATAAANVVNSPPTVAVSLNTTTSATTVLVASVVGEDPDRDELTYVYTWTLNGVVKRIVTTTATADRYDVSVKGNGKKDDVVTVTVIATDGMLMSPVATLSATIR